MLSAGIETGLKEIPARIHYVRFPRSLIVLDLGSGSRIDVQCLNPASIPLHGPIRTRKPTVSHSASLQLRVFKSVIGDSYPSSSACTCRTKMPRARFQGLGCWGPGELKFNQGAKSDYHLPDSMSRSQVTRHICPCFNKQADVPWTRSSYSSQKIEPQGLENCVGVHGYQIAAGIAVNMIIGP